MATTLQDLLDSVKSDVHGKSFPDAVILKYLNEAVFRMGASKFQLPGLAQQGSVLTSPTSVSVKMPADYHRELQFVQSTATQNRIWLEKSWIKFARFYPILYNADGSVYLTGDCERVAMRSPGNSLLYYQPVPQPGDKLILYYFRLPVPLTLDNLTGVPDGIPDEFVDGFCAGWAKWKLWKKIEQEETKKNNSGQYHSEFEQAFLDLKEYLGPPDEEMASVGDELFRGGGGPASFNSIGTFYGG